MFFHLRSLLLFIYWLILIDYECHAIKLFIESLLYIWFIPAVKLQSVTITQSVEVMLSLLWLYLFLFFIYSTGLCQLYYSINIREDANQVSVFFSCPVSSIQQPNGGMLDFLSLFLCFLILDKSLITIRKIEIGYFSFMFTKLYWWNWTWIVVLYPFFPIWNMSMVCYCFRELS